MTVWHLRTQFQHFFLPLGTLEASRQRNSRYESLYTNNFLRNYLSNITNKKRKKWTTVSRNSRNELIWRNRNGTRESGVFICQLDSWRPVVSSTSTTWRHGSNEAEASLHADARRLCETVEEKAAWIGRTNPSRSGFETTRHGPSGMLIKSISFLFKYSLW